MTAAPTTYAAPVESDAEDVLDGELDVEDLVDDHDTDQADERRDEGRRDDPGPEAPGVHRRVRGPGGCRGHGLDGLDGLDRGGLQRGRVDDRGIRSGAAAGRATGSVSGAGRRTGAPAGEWGWTCCLLEVDRPARRR